MRKHKEILTRPQQIEALEKWCGSAEVRAESLVRYALAEMEVNDDLRNCTPTSVYLSLLACGVTGLVPGKLRGFAFLVPFGNKKLVGEGKDRKELVVHEATFMMGWRGCKHIGYRAGLDLVSAVIHENDTFDFDKGSSPYVRFKPALKGAGAQLGAAAWVVLPKGRIEIEYMPMSELEDVKKAATRFRKSPAWEGPFRDQMERKTALKRLSKQVEAGEEFFKANAIEQAQDDHGSPATALDELTDGQASKFLGQRSAEAAAFEHLPRNPQVQVPANDAAANQQQAQQGVPPRATNRGASRPRVVDAESTERPTQAATGGGSPNSSGSTSPAPAGNAQTRATGSSSPTTPSPTGPTPATSSGGSASPPASAAGPAASSSGASTTAPTASTASASAGSTGSSADGQAPDQSQSQSEDAGDVAGEPSPDGDFDLAFGEDPTDAEAEAKPTRFDYLADFQTWAEAHPTRDAVAADPTWRTLVTGWLEACSSQAELDEHKAVFTQWSSKVFSKGRAADPRKNIAAIPPDEGVSWLVKAFGERYKAVS